MCSFQWVFATDNSSRSKVNIGGAQTVEMQKLITRSPLQWSTRVGGHETRSRRGNQNNTHLHTHHPHKGCNEHNVEVTRAVGGKTRIAVRTNIGLVQIKWVFDSQCAVSLSLQMLQGRKKYTCYPLSNVMVVKWVLWMQLITGRLRKRAVWLPLLHEWCSLLENRQALQKSL